MVNLRKYPIRLYNPDYDWGSVSTCTTCGMWPLFCECYVMYREGNRACYGRIESETTEHVVIRTDDGTCVVIPQEDTYRG
jgi:hypothetical protein